MARSSDLTVNMDAPQFLLLWQWNFVRIARFLYLVFPFAISVLEDFSINGDIRHKIVVVPVVIAWTLPLKPLSCLKVRVTVGLLIGAWRPVLILNKRVVTGTIEWCWIGRRLNHWQRP